MNWREVRVKRYFRYHHFRPLVAFNNQFNSVLGHLEGKVDGVLCDTGDINKSWREILDSINSLSEKEVVELYDYMIEEKGNK